MATAAVHPPFMHQQAPPSWPPGAGASLAHAPFNQAQAHSHASFTSPPPLMAMHPHASFTSPPPPMPMHPHANFTSPPPPTHPQFLTQPPSHAVDLPARNESDLTRPQLITILTHLSLVLPSVFPADSITPAHPVRLIVHGGACMLLHEGLAELGGHIPAKLLGSPGGRNGTMAQRQTTRDVDIVLRAFVAEWEAWGLAQGLGRGRGEEAREKLGRSILETARRFGLGKDWMNSDADVALPMGIDPTGTPYDPIAAAALHPDNTHLHTIFTSPNRLLVMVSVTPFWAVALKLVRYTKWDPGDICLLLRNGTLLSGTKWTTEMLEDWLKRHCWAMGYASYDFTRRSQMKSRIEHAVQLVNAWESEEGGGRRIDGDDRKGRSRSIHVTAEGAMGGGEVVGGTAGWDSTWMHLNGAPNTFNPLPAPPQPTRFPSGSGVKPNSGPKPNNRSKSRTRSRNPSIEPPSFTSSYANHADPVTEPFIPPDLEELLEDERYEREKEQQASQPGWFNSQQQQQWHTLNPHHASVHPRSVIRNGSGDTLEGSRQASLDDGWVNIDDAWMNMNGMNLNDHGSTGGARGESRGERMRRKHRRERSDVSPNPNHQHPQLADHPASYAAPPNAWYDQTREHQRNVQDFNRGLKSMLDQTAAVGPVGFVPHTSHSQSRKKKDKQVDKARNRDRLSKWLPMSRGKADFSASSSSEPSPDSDVYSLDSDEEELATRRGARSSQGQIYAQPGMYGPGQGQGQGQFLAPSMSRDRNRSGSSSKSRRSSPQPKKRPPPLPLTPMPVIQPATTQPPVGHRSRPSQGRGEPSQQDMYAQQQQQQQQQYHIPPPHHQPQAPQHQPPPPQGYYNQPPYYQTPPQQQMYQQQQQQQHPYQQQMQHNQVQPLQPLTNSLGLY